MNELEAALTALGDRIDAPRADLTGRVRARVERPVARRKAWRSIAVAAAAALLLGAAVLIAWPQARSAVADWLGIGGVRIETDRGAVLGGPGPLDLGRRVSPAEASALVDFEVRTPDLLEEPDAYYYDPRVPGGQVAVAYRARPGLPAAPGTRLGALVTQFAGTVDDPVLLKKITGPGVVLRRVVVSGAEGYWITGGPHLIAYLGPDGQPREETVRLAGNVVLWEQDGVTYRVESTLGRADALAVARSLR